MRAGALGRRRGIHEPLVGELFAPDEFFREVARVDRAGRAVHGFREHVHFHREMDQVRDEFVDCEDMVSIEVSRSQGGRG